MANSLIVGGLKMGMCVAVATPNEYKPDDLILDFANDYDSILWTTDPKEAVQNADVVITDTWASMGVESEKEIRKIAFAPYQVNDSLMELAKENAMVLHCLPAYREQEITEKVFEEHADEIFEEAENRLHAQKAVMVLLMKD